LKLVTPYAAILLLLRGRFPLQGYTDCADVNYRDSLGGCCGD